MTRPSTEIVTETRHAAFEIETRAADGERRVSLSFSSEAPVLRNEIPGFGGPAYEVLGHGTDEVDLTGLEPGRSPLLLDHRRDLESQIGVIEQVTIENGRGRAVVRLARTARGDEMLARIADREVSQVSVGYSAQQIEPRGELDGLPLVRVTRWTPREISLVAIAADSTVGIGRSAPGGGQPQLTRMKTMENQHNGASAQNGEGASRETGAAQARVQERSRIAEIQAAGREFELPPEMVEDAVRDGTSSEAFNRQVLAHLRANDGGETRSRATMQALGAPALHGRSERRYSIRAAAEAQLTGDWSGAGFEREMSQESRRQLGRSPEGVFVPVEALASRALVTTASQPAMVGTEHMSGAFIDALRPQSVVLASGAQSLDGLTQNVSIPKLAAGATAEWVTEGQAPTESDPQAASVPLTARQLSASVRMTRKQLRQSLPGLDGIIENDLRMKFATALDEAAIAGFGPLEPLGILNSGAAGVTIEQVLDSGGALAWPDVTALMSRVQRANIPMAAPGFISTWEVRGRMLSTPRFPGGDGPGILEEPRGSLVPGGPPETIAGVPARFSSLVPSNLSAGSDRHALIFGDFAQLMIGTWAAMDLIVDEYSEAAAGNIRIAAHLFADVALRHGSAFGALDNINPF